MRWTEAQRQAITTLGRGLLVSAAAGSGKTSVLAQRCVHLVCDAADRCDVGQLLVVTFTEAAAAEMKSRIASALRERCAREHDPHVLRQLAMIDHAHVSTVHGFCNHLLRQHFQQLGLDPLFRVIDADEALLLRHEAVRQLFLDCYEQDPAFQEFVDAYGEGRDQALMDLVVKTHEMLLSLLDPRGWRDHALGELQRASTLVLADSELGRAHLQQIASALSWLVDNSDRALQRLGPCAAAARYVQHVQGLREQAMQWQTVLQSQGYDALVALARQYERPRLPALRGANAELAAAKALVEPIHECLKKDGELLSWLAFDTAYWQEGLRRVLPHARVFLGLVEQLGQRYAQRKQQMRGLDFSDLERLALQLLRDSHSESLAPSPIGRLLHRQFRHVLVDEYQDINQVQDAILLLCSHECLGGQPSNLFCVGDVKQSIYRFRLAEPNRFLRRLELYSGGAAPGRVIDLQSNFRSRQPLLEALNQVFVRLLTRAAVDIEYDHTQQLHPGLEYPDAAGVPCFSGAPVELHLLPVDLSADAAADDEEAPAAGDDEAEELDRAQREAAFIAWQIGQLMGSSGGGTRHSVMERGPDGKLAPRPLEYRDIVVLLRSLRFQAQTYAQVLRQQGIPVHAAGGVGFFNAMEVRDMLALLELLNNQHQDVPLAAFLRSPLGGLPHAEDALAQIRLAYPGSREAPVPFHVAVQRYATEVDDALAAKLRDLLAQLRLWRHMAQCRPLAELLWEVYHQSGYLAFCGGLDRGAQRCANLLKLHQRAAQFDGFSRMGLRYFMEFLRNLEEQADATQASDASDADNVVRIMSVHAAKGLEFPVVFVADLGKRINLRDCQGAILADRQAGLGMEVCDPQRWIRYPSLASALVKPRLRQQALAEEMRVLYVAMTRAREHLVLVGTAAPGCLEKWQREWSACQGPLPAATVLAANTLLDWLGPVAAAINNAATLAVRIHSGDEVQRWLTAAHAQSPRRQQLEPFAQLQPLAPPPPPDAVAVEVMARLSSGGAYLQFSRLPAAASVTSLAKQHGVGGDGAVVEAALELPRFLAQQQVLAPTERGQATHLVLEHFDFQRGDQLDQQIERMVIRRLLTEGQAQAVDRDTIRWLLDSPLGLKLRRQSDSLRRELAFNYALPAGELGGPASSEPMDQVMLRGRVDLLLGGRDGWEVVDYKTDHVSGQRLADRVEQYRGQMQFYCRAIEGIVRQRVAAMHLVFLHARQVVSFAWEPENSTSRL